MRLRAFLLSQFSSPSLFQRFFDPNIDYIYPLLGKSEGFLCHEHSENTRHVHSHQRRASRAPSPEGTFLLVASPTVGSSTSSW
ncbi:Uncharacterized protein HZ326_28845, partial [Fusarium oxysporum f. sp. albedinis]